ncbi:MAG: Hpt domain-containing protein, partial [Burkholderiales bacterium]
MQLPEDALYADPTRPAGDLGPLAWVLEELRKVLGGAGKTLRRFAREAEAARADGVAPPAVTLLSAVPQQLYQSAGALEMVDQSSAAVLLRSMESTVNAFLRRPELCTESAAATVERAGAALIEYLETVLARKAVSAVCLFPQYRDVTELVEGDKAHPADLWTMQWRWTEPRLKPTQAPLGYGGGTRSRLDHAVLKIVKSADPAAAREVANISLGLAAGPTAQRPSIFWQISAAFFEALAVGLLPTDLYVKRLASRILMQFSALARGDEDVPSTLVRDLLFYCAHARAENAAAPVLVAVRDAFGLNRVLPVDYEMRRFGRFDPAHLAQARRRIHSAAESWSQVASGDTAKLRLAGEHFRLLSDAMLQVQPESIELAHALQAAAGDALRAGRAPTPALAMEVATAVLYLQAAYDDLDQDDSRLVERVARLADRLEHVRAGGQPEPLEPWMEELYRRVSDRQTMGSVVEEMRASLASVEKSLDQFFRDTSDRGPLGGVSSQLSQMRGVMSVLGLNQASHAVMRMRDSVDRFMAGDQRTLDSAEPAFEKLGNSLGALGFLVDMLSYQPALAKKMFVYDEEAGELRPVMGRTTTEQVPLHAAPALPEVALPTSAEYVEAPEAVFDSPTLPPEMADEADELEPMEQVEWAAPVEPEPTVQASETASAMAEAVPAPADEPEVVDTELLEIFLEEAREVVASGLAAIEVLAKRPADSGEQTVLRRAFHTLKGSSRMVGLNGFGEAAWSMEQLHNAWLADQKSADQPVLQLSRSALHAFGGWVDAIEQGAKAPWSATDFRAAADALRLESRLVELGGTPAAQEAIELPRELPVPEVAEHAEIEALSQEMLEDESAVAPDDIGDLTEQMPLDAAGQRGVDLALDWFEPSAGLLEAELPEATESEATRLEEGESEEREAALLAADAAEIEPEFAAPAEAAASDEDFKVIGDLRVGIPLYQVYLSEADEWSRRLSTDVSEWALDTSQTVPESAVAMAHSIAGISGTVGFISLSMLARTLERALGHAQVLGNGAAHHAQVFADAATDVDRLLQQFAAGFLKEADPQVLAALDEVLNTEGQSVLAALDLREAQADASPAENDDIETITPESVLPETAELPEAAELQEPEDVAAAEEEGIEAVASAGEPTAAEEFTAAEEPTALDDAIIFEPARTVLADAPVQLVQNLDDDIDAVDAIDPDLFPIFEDEAVELLPKLAGALRQWVAMPDDEGARSESLRVLHTLKGSARLAGALRLGEMAHRMESDIAIHAGEVPAASQIEPLLGRLDTIQAELDQLRNAPVAAPVVVDEIRSEERVQPAELSDATGEVQPASVMVPVAASQAAKVGAQSVRVRSQVLDRLVNQAGEIMMSRSRLETRIAQLRDSMSDLSDNLDRLRQQLRDVELQAETQMQSRLAQSKDSGATFDPLEFDRFTRVQELTRMMAESVNDVATVQRSVQRSVEGAEDD